MVGEAESDPSWVNEIKAQIFAASDANRVCDLSAAPAAAMDNTKQTPGHA
jgi:hypothetical protein